MAKIISAMTGMPKMRAAFYGWKSKITLVKVENSIDEDGFNQPIENIFQFKGTIQPLSAEELELKPDAQRSFEWLQIHAEVGTGCEDVALKVGDKILYDSRPFRIKAKKDYTLNNYIEYHALEVVENG